LCQRRQQYILFSSIFSPTISAKMIRAFPCFNRGRLIAILAALSLIGSIEFAAAQRPIPETEPGGLPGGRQIQASPTPASVTVVDTSIPAPVIPPPQAAPSSAPQVAPVSVPVTSSAATSGNTGGAPLAPDATLAQRVWNNSGTDYNSTGSWTGGVVPSGNNNAAFNVAEVTQPNLSASVSISGIVFSTTGAFGYDITRTNSAVFTLTGQTAGSAAQSTNSDSAAIFAANTSGTNTIDVPLTLAPASGTTSTFNQASGGTLIVNGVISGSGITLSLAGAGIVQLNGANLHTGGTTLGGTGTVQIGDNAALGTGTFTNSSTGITQATGGSRTIANNVLWSGNGTVGGGNDLTINGTFTSSGAASRTLTVNNTGTTTLAGNVFLAPDNTTARGLTIAGSGAVTISGVIANNNAGNSLASAFGVNSTGTVTISNANTYSGATTLSSGTLILGNKAVFGTGTVGWNGVSTSASTNLSGANAIANTSSLGASGNVFTGTNNLELSGTVTNTVTGTDTITNNMSGGAVLTLSGSVNLSNNATTKTLAFNGSGNTTVSGVIANGGGSTSTLAYSGTGLLTLSNANTYSGGTSVTGGTLLVINTSGSGTGTTSVTVTNSGTTLAGGTTNGAGGISGAVNINPSATLSAGTSGNGAGTTAILHTGALTLVSGSNFAVDLNTTTAGTGYDQLSVTGTVNLGGTLASNLLVTAANTLTIGDKFFIVLNDSTDLVSGTFAQGATVTAPNGEVFAINYVDNGDGGTLGNDISLTLTAVPEPSTWIGGALTFAALGWSQRKRVKKLLSRNSKVENILLPTF
jgi:fibronectin-binding autotransporter adhesin